MTKSEDILSTRLKDMLLETSKASVTTSSNQRSSLVNKPLIEILSHDDDQSTEKNAYFEGGPYHANRTEHGLDVDDEDDDDDAPPPIHFHGNYPVKYASMQNDANNTTNQNELDATTVPKTVSNTVPNNSIETNESTCSIPLAEQMMAEAQRANEVQSTQKNKQERSKAQKATFGFQKGFLNSSKKSSKKRKDSKSSNLVAKSCQGRDGDKESTKEDEKQDNNLIYELDGDGNMVPLPPTLPTANNPSKSTSSTNPLLLPQVQQAMSAHLQSTTHEWATTDLLESISRNHPKLAAGLNNPKYTATLQSMQTHPEETMKKLKKEQHSDILEFIQEFCGVMGEHFVQLGESKENKKEKEEHTKQQQYSSQKQNSGMNNDESAKIKEMGPLEEKAMREHRDQKNKANTNETKSKESNKHGGIDDDQVAAILSNDELRLILMDPKMQHVMEECTQTSSGGGHGRGLRYYMSHEEYGPKLRKLMEAGLLRTA